MEPVTGIEPAFSDLQGQRIDQRMLHRHVRSFVAHHFAGVIIPLRSVRICVLLAVCNQCFSGH